MCQKLTLLFIEEMHSVLGSSTLVGTEINYLIMTAKIHVIDCQPPVLNDHEVPQGAAQWRDWYT